MATKRKPSPSKQPETDSSSEYESEEEEVDASESEEESESESEPEQQQEEDLSNRKTLANLIEPFSKDQLIQLLTESLPRNPTLFRNLTKSADSDLSHRKIFVYGLGWDCTVQTLTSAFQPYGPIEDCKVILDRVTNRSKGYGFVLFKTRHAAKKALKEPQKAIGGRTASCQLASKGNVSNAGSNSNTKPKVASLGNGNVVAPPLNVQTTGYVTAQPSMGLTSPGVNRSGTQSMYGVNGLSSNAYGVNGLSSNAYGVNSVSPGVIGSYQSQVALQRMGINSVSPSVIGSYQSQEALQGLRGYKNQSGLGASKSGSPPFFGR